MEDYKISKLLNNSIVSKFIIRKWIKVNNLSGGQYSANKNIAFKFSLLKLDLCNYSDAYVVAKRRVSVEGSALDNRANKKLVFKNNTAFRSCISKSH